MDLGQRLREVAIALVGHDDRVPVSAIRKFAPGDADIGRQEAVAQHGARFGEQLHRLREVARRVEMRVDAAEIALHLRRVEVHGRRDDVATASRRAAG